jgi:hypothetical protein
MINLEKEKMYVLGPLELCPHQFAVGERSYAAIRGKMPYYNAMRQDLYQAGKKELGDAIGELEARALTAEEALKEMTAAYKAAKAKIESIAEEFYEFKKANEEAIKKFGKKKKENKNA